MNQNETATRGGNGPAQSIPPLPPGWSLDRGTLSHGAMATHVGHLGSVVRERVAVELERCGFAAFASAWRGLPAAPSAIPGVLVVVQRPDGSVVSCDYFAHPDFAKNVRQAVEGTDLRLQSFPLSAVLEAPRCVGAARRLELIQEVMDKAYLETESWESEDKIGASLAYLASALSDTSSPQAYCEWAHDEPARILFNEWFPKDHEVWNFIAPLES